ncbi:MAG: hypothetical protein ACKV22_19565 [Bryobacteraceae bacterium]
MGLSRTRVCFLFVAVVVGGSTRFAAAQQGSPLSSGPWSAAIQTGIAQVMQLSLGGTFNQGPAQQNRLTVTRTSLFRSADSLQLYGWTTTDLRKASVDFETGFRYRAPLRRFAGGTMVGGTGLEHWNYPSVLTGTRDLVLDSYLGWIGGERFPVTLSGNGKTLLVSDLPRGTFVCVQAQHTFRLFRRRGVSLSIQHGPAYVYSWGLYGRVGHRVLRYYATPQLSRGRWTVEFMARPQAGLQPYIPDNGYWFISFIRRFGG